MNCENCKIIIKKDHSLCDKCYSNKNIIISESEVKKIYKLTDNDLSNCRDELWYNCYTHRVYKTVCTIYLHNQIHQYVEKLVKTLELKDPRYKSFIKQDIIMTKIKDDHRLICENKINIINYIDSFIEKLNYDTRYDYKYYISNNIETISHDYNGDFLQNVMPIIDIIKNNYAMAQRIYNYLDTEIDKKYHNNDKIISLTIVFFFGLISSSDSVE